MYPPAPGIDREATEEIEYNGYKVPKGSIIAVSSYDVVLTTSVIMDLNISRNILLFLFS